MATLDPDRLAKHYASLPDDLLLEDYGLGPEAFLDRAAWDLLVAEVQARGLKSGDDVQRDLAWAAAVEADPNLAVKALYCGECLDATTDEGCGDTHLFRLFLFFIGDTLIGRSDVCPTCGSYVARHWFVFLLPLVPSYQYRVVDTGWGQFVSRRVAAA